MRSLTPSPTASRTGQTSRRPGSTNSSTVCTTGPRKPATSSTTNSSTRPHRRCRKSARRSRRLREAAKGLLQKVEDAIEEFAADPARFIINGLLKLVHIPPDAFWALMDKIGKVIDEIAADPMKFGNNLMAAIGQGFSNFFGNIGKHLLEGMLQWLFSAMDDVGVTLPKDFSLSSVITFFLQVMGITWPRIRKLLAKHIGEENVALIEKAWSIISSLIEKGPAGIWELIKDKLNPKTILDAILTAARDALITALMKQAAIKIAELFIPGGAILEALEAIYDVLKWVFKNAAKIFRLVETVVNGIDDIFNGNISGMAKAVENALAMMIVPVIDFLAELLSLDDIPRKIAGVVKDLQAWVEEILDSVIGWLVEQGKALLKSLGLGKDEDKKEGAKGGEVGKLVTFTAGTEIHRLRIRVSGTNAEAVMASEEKPVGEYLDEYEKKAGELADKDKSATVIGLIGQARGLVEKVNSQAKKMAGDVKNPEAKPEEVSAEGNEVESEEDQLAAKLKEIREALGLQDPEVVKREVAEEIQAPAARDGRPGRALRCTSSNL